MGVHGLWKLIEPSGKVVPLDTLEGKVLAVDISIWLHQAIKGYQDSKGAPIPNAHLLTIYNRVCKLLYFRIKPVFVFDGGVPALKKETIAKRNQLKHKNQSEADKIQKQLINTLLKHSAVNKVLSERTRAELGSKAKKIASKNEDDDDLFVLPPSQTTYESSDSCEESFEDGSCTSDSSPTKYFNIHDVDEKSTKFKSLPADVRHEILTDLKETRKQNSWGRIHELPKQSDDFSGYQMRRLLKRYSIQTCLEEAEKEMGGATLSLNELESLLNDHGVITENQAGKRIASDENTRYLYIKDVKKALESTRKQEVKQKESEKELTNIEDDSMTTIVENSETDQDLQEAIKLSLLPDSITDSINEKQESVISANNDFEYQQNLAAAIKLSLQDSQVASTSKVLQSYSTPTKLDEIMSSEDVTSSETTPVSSQEVLEANFSTYLQTLKDADFVSSEDESLLDESLVEGQKAADKIFSAARNYMLEYGGLTQAGVAEIFGKNEPNTKKIQILDNQLVQKKFTENCKNAGETGETGEAGEKQKSVDFMSESSSDDDFVEVSSDYEENKQLKSDSKGLQITFDKKEALVDDLFSDIFTSQQPIAEKTKVDQQLDTNQQLKSPALDNSALNISSEDIETQQAIEESLKLDKPPITSQPEPNLMQELISQKPSATEGITVEDLKQLKSTLNEASSGLILERGAKERMGSNISDQMYHEAQDLLSLFGIPYIVAPMEAEAQCAFLNEVDLTDGTITDDSDIWLFGGKTVYKNFFNHDKQVLEFKADSIQHHFKLTRHQLISLAMLVGSDYTIGIQGIGPVTALEVLAAFPSKSNIEVITSLERFRDWFTTGKKVFGRGKAILRNKLKNIELHDGFPSTNVLKAYLEPSVEPSRESFTWGKPRVDALITYTREKFGWTAKKVTDTLDPVLRRMSDNTQQKRIQDYFKTVYKPPLNTSLEIQNKLSKRVKKALGTMAQENFDGLGSSDDEMAEAVQVLKNTQKLTRKKHKSIQKEVEGQLKVIDKKSMEANALHDAVEAKKPRLVNLHRKEVIPQREFTKSNLIQNKMKAIEVFRKSKKGPGYVKKRNKVVRTPKEDAGLSESSESD